MPWDPVWVLPNISIDEPVEHEFFVLAPYTDARVRTISRQNLEFRIFTGRFYDTFKNRIRPALILRRRDAPERLKTLEAAASFRDVLVASMIPHSWATNLQYGGGRQRATYSSYFSIHPWMTDRNYEHITTNGEPQVRLHTKFRHRFFQFSVRV